MLRVVHRDDQLLQVNVEAFKSRGLSGDDYHDNISAIHAALLDFIDKRLVGSPFVDRVALELALSEWPAYAYDKGIRRLEIWGDLMILDGEIRTRRIGPGGPFVCAMVEEVVNHATVQIHCRGRNVDGESALETAIDVMITIDQPEKGGLISVGPRGCPFNTGGHGQRCKASHPNQDKVGEGVICPFSFDYPYVREVHEGWVLPAELAEFKQQFGID